MLARLRCNLRRTAVQNAAQPSGIADLFGGLQMPMPTSIVPLARAASLMEIGPHLRQCICGWGFTVGEAKAVDEVDEAVTGGLLQELFGKGVSVGPCGVPLSQPLELVQNAECLRPPVAQRHLLGMLLQHTGKVRVGELMREGSDRDKTRLQSADGPTAGSSGPRPNSI